MHHGARGLPERENVYGFVSFSDHGSTYNSWAGVWALESAPRIEAEIDAPDQILRGGCGQGW